MRHAAPWYLVQLLLPQHDAHGKPYAREMYDDLTRRLTATFGGVTAHTRAPAIGAWQPEPGESARALVVYEVMAERVDQDWWHTLRRELETTFAQKELVIRSFEVHKL